jgi:altronate dehydratase
MTRAVVVSDRDNVATALEPLEAGTAIVLGARSIVARVLIPAGHKIALAEISEGQPVVKYGSSIGVATAAIRVGDHVHTHNVASRRGRGDLEQMSATRGEAP